MDLDVIATMREVDLSEVEWHYYRLGEVEYRISHYGRIYYCKVEECVVFEDMSGKPVIYASDFSMMSWLLSEAYQGDREKDRDFDWHYHGF